MTRRTTRDNALPLPTASEAAFERVLAEFDAEDGRGAESSAPVLCHPEPPRSGVSKDRPEPAEGHQEAKDDFVDRLFRQSKNYLAREPYAGIADASHFHTKVVGVSFERRQDMLAGLSEGLELSLERQPENPHDANAIAVKFGAMQIGFLKKDLARQLAPHIDKGVRYRARIASLTGGVRDKNRGVNIYVQREAAIALLTQQRIEERGHADHDALRRALIGDAMPHAAQEAVLARVDAGKNTLAVLGTGRGKSFCFQYPAAFRALDGEQKTLILYPLRALANDQYEAMQRRFDGFGLRIYRANGSIGTEERDELMAALREGTWDIVLSTPEFLHFHRDAFSGKSTPSFVVVDEAHHIYESKHRGAYGRLGETIASLGKPQVLAVTATAGDAAFSQIINDLRIEAWVIDPTIRENLTVTDARETKEKIGYLRELLEGHREKAIVYCNSRTEATSVAEALRRALGNEVMFYHAGMPSSERLHVEDLFRRNELRVVVATSAFGEGIDLPDVRHVVLYHLNFDFTEFNQQSGRAGRDGKPAQIHLLFGQNDRRINDFIIDREAPTLPVLREIYKGLRGIARDGIVRMTLVDIARTLDLDKANERTVGVAVRIFEEEGLIESGIDDDGRYLKFLSVDGKVDLTRNERFAEGEAERENFARFCDLVLSAKGTALERIINRPIYPERVELER
jgi:single-stranded-DNA-specific exonuclease